jgi:hypothetical protein
VAAVDADGTATSDQYPQARLIDKQTRSAPESSRYNGMLQIGIRLETDAHASLASRRLRAYSSRCCNSGLAGLAPCSSSSHFFFKSER